MKFLMICDFLCLPEVIWFLMKMKKKGVLNDKRWAIIIVAYFNLTSIVISMNEFTSSKGTVELTYPGLLVFVLISLIWWVIVYPFSRWIYREMFEPKKK
jgi:hypothetical protein